MRAVERYHIEIAKRQIGAHAHCAGQRNVFSAVVQDFGAARDDVFFEKYTVGKTDADSA